MTKEELFRAVGEVREDRIIGAETVQQKNRSRSAGRRLWGAFSFYLPPPRARRIPAAARRQLLLLCRPGGADLSEGMRFVFVNTGGEVSFEKGTYKEIADDGHAG